MTTTQLEKQLNFVIRNGVKLAEGQLGTVLPTRAQLARMDKFADKQRKAVDAQGAKEFAHAERRVVGGEVRYYVSETRFAVKNRSGRSLWFEIRNGEIYAAK